MTAACRHTPSDFVWQIFSNLMAESKSAQTLECAHIEHTLGNRRTLGGVSHHEAVLEGRRLNADADDSSTHGDGLQLLCHTRRAASRRHGPINRQRACEAGCVTYTKPWSRCAQLRFRSGIGAEQAPAPQVACSRTLRSQPRRSRTSSSPQCRTRARLRSPAPGGHGQRPCCLARIARTKTRRAEAGRGPTSMTWQKPLRSRRGADVVARVSICFGRNVLLAVFLNMRRGL